MLNECAGKGHAPVGHPLSMVSQIESWNSFTVWCPCDRAQCLIGSLQLDHLSDSEGFIFSVERRALALTGCVFVPALSSRGGSRGESTKISKAVIPLFLGFSFNGTAQHSLVVGCQILHLFFAASVIFLTGCSL